MVMPPRQALPAKLRDCSRSSSRGKPNHVRPPLTGRAQIHLHT